MQRALPFVALALLPVAVLGCQNLDAPVELQPVLPLKSDFVYDQNPVFLPLPPQDYPRICEAVIQVLGDYGFEVVEANRYSGHFEAAPRISPGLLLFFKPGTPTCYDRLLSTLQTYRHRVSVVIETADPQPADHGGYFVTFIVRKELEDLPRPLRSTVGGAVFRTEPSIERQNEVIDATYFEAGWIFRGRDAAMEQELIRRFKNSL